MKKQISFAVVSDGNQEMIVNFHPALEVTSRGEEFDIMQYLGDVFTKLGGSEVLSVKLDSEAIALLEDRESQIVKPPKPAADTTSITKSANKFKREN